MLRGVLLVFIGAACFGVLSTFVKFAYANGYTLGEVSGVQALFGTVILGVVALLTQKLSVVFRKQSLFQTMLFGSASGLVSLTYYKCVQLVPASIAILLLMQFVWMSMLIDAILHKKYPSQRQWIAVVLIIAGTVLAAGIFNETAVTLSFLGIFYGLLAALFYAAYITANHHNKADIPPAVKSFWMMFGALVLISIVFPPQYLLNGKLMNGLWWYGLPLALFGTVIPPFCFASGMPKAGLSLGAIVSSVELPVAVLMSAFVLKETVSGLQWLGVFVILFAVVWVNLPPAKTRKPAV